MRQPFRACGSQVNFHDRRWRCPGMLDKTSVRLLPTHINRACRSSDRPSFARNRPRRPRRRNSRAKRIRIDSASVARHCARAADSRKRDHRAGNVQTDVRYNPRIAGLLNFACVFDVLNCISHASKACAAETATSMTETASRRLRCDWQTPVRETWSVNFGEKRIGAAFGPALLRLKPA
ncbi:hypothetical protein BCAR13_710066 [Paraburkholderia caribensis]|nr:hypothetical protein BCAR13_710066 [Paraburkholderia caribensis]